MSGHSKWSSIKHKKGAADVKRGKLFSKLSRAIIVAARDGGPDPGANLALQNAIEKARSYSMPKDNIDRAIAKGSGADADASTFETVVYEGYGPSCVAVIVEALTDNRNRTAGEVRHTFAKNDGNLGTSGAVAWLFERRGIVLVPADGVDEDELMLAAAEGGADDVELDGTSFQISVAPERLTAVREAVEAAGFAIDSAELTMVPKTTVEVADENEAKKILRLIDQLEDSDDVSLDGSSFQVLCAAEQLATVRDAVEAAGFAVESAELTMLPKTTVAVEDENEAKKILRLIDQLEDNDDVQDVYANFDIPERVLEAVAG